MSEHRVARRRVLLVGTSPESVNKQLRAWRREGLVHFDRGYVTILDVAGLEAIARYTLHKEERKYGKNVPVRASRGRGRRRRGRVLALR